MPTNRHPAPEDADLAATTTEEGEGNAHRIHTRMWREINTRLTHLDERLETRFYHLEQRLEMRSRQLAQQVQDGFAALVLLERRITWLTIWLLVAAGIMIAAGGGLTWVFRLLGLGPR